MSSFQGSDKTRRIRQRKLALNDLTVTYKILQPFFSSETIFGKMLETEKPEWYTKKNFYILSLVLN